MNKTNRKKKQSNAEKPISLQPLKFDEAVTDLLQVKPETKDEPDPKQNKNTLQA